MSKLFSCFLLLLLLSLASSVARAQPTTTQSINANWLFQKGDGTDFSRAAPVAGWEPVSLPHTWNAADTYDDVPGYYRGAGWYKKSLYVPARSIGARVYLEFEGANQLAEVYVNGQKAGEHRGGYTAFRLPIEQLLKADATAVNEVLVKVDNSYNADLAPLTADFTFYGGLYRDAYLVRAGPVHFDLDNYASPGIFVSTPRVSAETAEVVVRGALVNETSQPRRVLLTQQLLDAEGRTVARQQTRLTLPAGRPQAFEQAFRKLRRPRLWSPADPYLYRVVSTIEEAGAQPVLLDEATNVVGFRWFRFDAARGFFLNGQPLKLMGASRHQDFAGLGNALPDALPERDVQLLKDMGGNFLRIAHYPQDPAVLRACDRLGVLASEEIPVVNQITESDAFFQNCRIMQTEMIRQHFNHPSVILWTYMNEVLLSIRGQDMSDAKGQTYLKKVAQLAQQLDDLSHREDPGRNTMLAMHGDFDLYRKAGLTAIPQVLGWNLYNGWYSAKFEGLDTFLDRQHRELPDKPFLISEYGADADPRVHAQHPTRFDKTPEYAVRYHQYYWQAIQDRPFVAGGAVWNLADFGSEGRQEATPHLNAKGLLTADRQPKDDYLFYQSRLLRTPFVRIGSRAWTLRGGLAAGADSLFCTQTVEVYTNQPTAELQLNGRSLGARAAAAGVARFRVPFTNGTNRLEATTPAGRDEVAIQFQLTPANLQSLRLPFRELNVSLGDQRTFTDAKLNQVWLPEQAYHPGGWGYVGGRVFAQANTARVSYGSDRDILGTSYDPIFQTQRIGIEQFRADVPPGDYDVTLHFAELQYLPPAEKLAYNLDKAPAAAPVPAGERRFDVSINGRVLHDIGTATGLRPQLALSETMHLTVAAGQGLVVSFRQGQGESILNGIQIHRR